MKIPVASADVSGNEESYVVDAIRSSWISSSGKYLDRFEERFAESCGVRAAIGVCNGTVALHLAVMALGLQPGDEVIVPSLTYIATANAVIYAGATPVFVDVESETWCIDPDKVKGAITERTKGVIVVHLYGHPADMDRINDVARLHSLWVIEDAAEAPFAKYKERLVGGLSTIATFSFYGNKVITSGEGGALTVNDPELEQRVRLLRGQGMDPNRRYWFPVVGYNYRLTNVCAAMLCAQIERKEDMLRRRREIYEHYRVRLEGVKGLGFQPCAGWAVISPWLFSVTVNAEMFGCSRDALVERLAAKDIESRPFFIALHTMPPFLKPGETSFQGLRETNRLSAEGINLPTFNTMTTAQIDRVCDAVIASVEEM